MSTSFQSPGTQPQRSQFDSGRRSCVSANASEQQNPLAQPDCLMSAALGGALLAASMTTSSWRRLLLAGTGAALAYRGFTGDRRMDEWFGIRTGGTDDPGVRARHGFKFETAISINASPDELYRRWQNLETLPNILSHIVSVEDHGAGRSHWVAEGPLNSTVEWDAEIINQRENELIAWQSLPGSHVATAGSVHFERQPGDSGTVLRVSLKYDPPAGKLGATLASWLGADLEEQVVEDLRRFKRVMEANRPATTACQLHASGGEQPATGAAGLMESTGSL